MRRCTQPRPSSPPPASEQHRLHLNSSVATSSIDVPAAASAATEIPVQQVARAGSASQGLAQRVEHETAGCMAPAKAAKGRARNVRPAQGGTAATAPRAAPAPTPRRPESASGLRKTDCSVAPTTASPPPTIAASEHAGKAHDPAGSSRTRGRGRRSRSPRSRASRTSHAGQGRGTPSRAGGHQQRDREGQGEP